MIARTFFSSPFGSTLPQLTGFRTLTFVVKYVDVSFGPGISGLSLMGRSNPLRDLDGFAQVVVEELGSLNFAGRETVVDEKKSSESVLTFNPLPRIARFKGSAASDRHQAINDPSHPASVTASMQALTLRSETADKGFEPEQDQRKARLKIQAIKQNTYPPLGGARQSTRVEINDVLPEWKPKKKSHGFRRE